MPGHSGHMITSVGTGSDGQLLTACCCRGDQWLSYDNERSIRVKTEYAWDEGLAGVMTWSIDTDDFRGACNGPKFPLLR